MPFVPSNQFALYSDYSGFEAAMEDRETQLDKYKKLLREQDWKYDELEDHALWHAGFNSMSRLKRLQQTLDPDKVLWDEEAPEDFQG